MPRAKVKSDPLISALIAKLPPAGEQWPVDEQIKWLNLMAATVSMVYGGDAVKQFTPEAQAKPALAPPQAPPKPIYPFYIDEEGYVRKGNGQRVMPNDVNDVVHDMRGEEGDLRKIIWADDSVGANGRALTFVGA